MKKMIRLAAVLGITTIALVGCGTSSDQSTSSTGNSSTQVAKVTASDFKWTIDKTTFKAGTPIEFDVKGQEGTHGFAIDGTDVNQMVAAGSTQKVTWTPPKAGTYTIRCNVMCGTGHGTMTATITVQ